MKTLILIMSFFIVGCAEKNYGVKTTEYNIYLAQFNEDLKKLGATPIDFSQTEIYNDNLGKYLGLCIGHPVKKSSGRAIIRIGNDIKEYPSFRKAALIYHEIGHCFLGLEHSKNYEDIMHVNYPDLARSSQIDSEFNRLALVKQMLDAANYR